MKFDLTKNKLNLFEMKKDINNLPIQITFEAGTKLGNMQHLLLFPESSY